MPKKPVKSPFQRLREQQPVSEDGSISIHDSRLNRKPRVEQSNEGELLSIFWPDANATHGVRRIDVSRLNRFPKFGKIFAEALLMSAQTKGWRTSTLVKNVSSIGSSFYGFLEAEGITDLSFGDINNALVNGYVRWLNRIVSNVSRLSVSSREAHMSCFRSLVEGLMKTSSAEYCSTDLELPSNIWLGQSSVAINKVLTIPHEDFAQLYQACLREMQVTSNDVRTMRQQMLEARDNPIVKAVTKHQRDELSKAMYGLKFGQIPNPYQDLGVVLATLKLRYPTTLVSLDALESDETDPSIGKAISRFHGGITKITRCFYPSARDLMPFLIMLAIHLHYNLETLLASKLADFSIRTNEIGRMEIVLSAEDSDLSEVDGGYLIAEPRKERAFGKRQEQVRPVDNGIDNPATIYLFLLDWCKDIRHLVDVNFRQRLFLFVSNRVKPGEKPRGFSGHGGQCGTDSTFDDAFSKFFRENGLIHYSFRTLRATGLDITDVLFGGDIIAKQSAGNHTDPDTTYKKYSTGGQMERGDEVLAELRIIHQRWRRTRQRIDPRNRPEGSDLGSATPGWRCLDPFTSPRGTKNSLCTDYGQCPVCPHCYVDTNSAYSYAQALNLLAAIDEAASEIAPGAWLQRWAPVKERILEYWLPRFSNTLKNDSKSYQLNPLPPLE